ncbi:DUF5060 domain-containing protein [Pelagicoccus enzymogenes]|uniref:DUF5060 domain-containing protein n=1 Tax=Pelagicoccus enzymogenes TaxID=2773457 RepID=UPI00280C654F|nr:DUF5060 domain-containing protein [Pelagicoccus enzymogenes]MDQ8199714.1 DUF5060 domain-containing protein [Pelagicoccus enzymogenes]
MHVPRLLFLLFSILASIFSIRISAEGTVEQWDCFELSFSAPATANPFVGVAFSATFEKDGKRFQPDGFYDGNDVFKIRFMPNEPGIWTYRTQSNYAPLNGKSGSFTCTPAREGNHGPVQVRKQYHFGYADGTAFRPFGTTSYEWWYQPDEMRDQTLATLATSPFNKLRFLVIPNYRKEYYKGGSLELHDLPFEGDSRETFDFSRFNPKFFQRLEENVLKLQDLGIEADLILFRPYDNAKWGFDQMSMETNERYLRYLVARLAAYRNVWWCMANEHSYIDHLTDNDWDQLFRVVQASDPYAHLRSVQNADDIYDFNKPWVTHVAFHNYMAIRSPGVPSIIRSIYRKPVIHDEINYEGDVDSRWGQLSSEEMTYRFWVGTIGGTYVTHGETKRGEIGDGWISRGGALTRQSPARIAFLREILEQSGLTEWEPIDPAFQTNIAGKPGKYYLIYLGKDQIESWPFVLPRDGLEPGMRFQADVIDTWNMTITPTDQTFEVERGGRYHFSDKTRQTIALPTRPYMALRIQRIPE